MNGWEPNKCMDLKRRYFLLCVVRLWHTVVRHTARCMPCNGGSGPFTDPKHSLRLYLSLAVAYMHGSSHINTEEALWTDEFMNDRYSPSGKEHLAAQHRVLDFIETHSRRGEFHSNIAVIQGRNDAWKSFWAWQFVVTRRREMEIQQGLRKF